MDIVVDIVDIVVDTVDIVDIVVDTVDIVDIVDTVDIVDIVDTVDIVDIVDTVDTLDIVHTVDTSHEEPRYGPSMSSLVRHPRTPKSLYLQGALSVPVQGP